MQQVTMAGSQLIGVSSRNRQIMRLAAYAALMICDLAAIHVAFRYGEQVRGSWWLSLAGFPLDYAAIPIYALASLSYEACGRTALLSRFESIRMALLALLSTSGVMALLIYFLHASDGISRIALGWALALSLLMICTYRLLFNTFFMVRDQTVWRRQLLILDGAPGYPDFKGEVLDAQSEGLQPDVHNPAILSQLGNRLYGYDAVTVACGDAASRIRWAQLLKSYNLHGEVVFEEGNPLGAIGIGNFQGHDSIVVTRGAMSLGNRVKKRLVDIVISGSLIIVLLPLLIVVAVAIMLDSRGPVLFRQPRVGYDNRIFKIYKFRSMIHESSDLAGNQSTARDDIRITRLGRFIRSTSIDELPQLLNVLMGDMSMVGPRPHALGSLAGDKLFWEIDNAYWHRHALKPGITGLAQVRGYRGATLQQSDLQNRLQSDLEYISGWSLWRDIRILLATVRVVTHDRAF